LLRRAFQQLRGGGSVPTYRSWNHLLTNKMGISATCSTKGTTMLSRGRIFAWGPILSMILSANVYAQVQNAMSTQDRQECLQKLRQILPSDPYFDAWLKNTGKLPPDFNALPRQNSLPDPLRSLNGRTGAHHSRVAGTQRESGVSPRSMSGVPFRRSPKSIAQSSTQSSLGVRARVQGHDASACNYSRRLRTVPGIDSVSAALVKASRPQRAHSQHGSLRNCVSSPGVKIACQWMPTCWQP